MLFQRVPYHFAVLLVLNLSGGTVFAQSTYSQEELNSAIKSIVDTNQVSVCDPFIEAGCHVPNPKPKGPDGCIDCNPSALLDALRKNDKFILPENIKVKGTEIKLQEKYELGSGTSLSLPAQIGQ